MEGMAFICGMLSGTVFGVMLTLLLRPDWNTGQVFDANGMEEGFEQDLDFGPNAETGQILDGEA